MKLHGLFTRQKRKLAALAAAATLVLAACSPAESSPDSAGGTRVTFRVWDQDAAAAYEAGELSVRDLHLALAAVLRGFATQRTGTPMESLTVAEILDLAQGADRRSVIDRIRFLRSRRRPVDRNPLGYDAVTRADALEAVHETTEVVTRW